MNLRFSYGKGRKESLSITTRSSVPKLSRTKLHDISLTTVGNAPYEFGRARWILRPCYQEPIDLALLSGTLSLLVTVSLKIAAAIG